ncbi:hypothetical protein GV828_11265 [Flavobacterium sp. NST-5]|uniref:Polysaccharide chain length determinant N-terminal domain-containing protein n=1 Tax=Flavobacterium ichthyis TaxID=2698827 RepID=A0ABW9ZDG8_9FLAO|nr:hypothetical protein [Flavobacterium ichthyis]NBL65779.1 hypothetical protein [Flavobacterium ichthyis]
MSSNAPQNIPDQEIDLAQVSQKIGGFFNNIYQLSIKFIFFVKRYIVVFILLFILGAGLGWYMDKKNNGYKHEIVVTPNFGSTDYLYGKIELLNSKINNGDTLFLKSLGFKHPKRLAKFKIEPIVDPYNFVKGSEENFELLKLMSEDGSIEKVIQDDVTSKNYAYHRITFSTKGLATDEAVINPLLNSFNDNAYYKVIQENIIQNVKLKIAFNEQTLNQINSILQSFSDETNKSSKGGNLVYYNENTQLNEILKTKDNLINEQGARRIELVNFQKIVKDVSIISNIKKKSGNKFIFPFIFIFGFIIAKIIVDLSNKKQPKI